MLADIIDFYKLDAHFCNLVVNFARSPLYGSDGLDSCAKYSDCAGVCVGHPSRARGRPRVSRSPQSTKEAL